MTGTSSKNYHHFAFKGFLPGEITDSHITSNTAKATLLNLDAIALIQPQHLDINSGVFESSINAADPVTVTVQIHAQQLSLSCNCGGSSDERKLCANMAIVTNAILKRTELRIFFDHQLRRQTLAKFAADYGMENETDLESYFSISLKDGLLNIQPSSPHLIRVTNDSLQQLKKQVIFEEFPISNRDIETAQQTIVVLRQHKFYRHLIIELYSGPLSKDGIIKNPLTKVDPLEQAFAATNPGMLTFLAAIARFQSAVDRKKSQQDIASLKAIVKNPYGYGFYLHQPNISENVTTGALQKIRLHSFSDSLKIAVDTKDSFYEIKAIAEIGDEHLPLSNASFQLGFFVRYDDDLYLPDSLQTCRVIELFASKQGTLLIHQSKYKNFKAQLLNKIEETTSITYRFIPKSSSAKLKEQGLWEEPQKIIYLSDSAEFVQILPVMRYGEMEVSVRSHKQIYITDPFGKETLVERDKEAETAFITLILKQHEFFREQLEDSFQHFYLHKKRFLEEEWFLQAFEKWSEHDITVYGFNELEGNKLNANRAKISVKVLSGENWFNALIDVSYGKRKASLKNIKRAVKNRSRYVQLDDGTLGILPTEWMEKFESYFTLAEVADDDNLQIPKTNFMLIEEIFDREMLDEPLRAELALFRNKLMDFRSIKNIGQPDGLQGELRPYQQQGLNWLNFLDDFNLGGCLADDMGLGKSIQILAFILSQRSKVSQNNNLLVVPTSLIFNWQHEIEKFAPSIRLLTFYGDRRVKASEDFAEAEIILTSYGTLLSDISLLKRITFNYIFLDESQHIKNPESQRYKAARLLRARNRIVITGTPFENNTFDIYGQLSFACPGLLGSKYYFKNVFFLPIDQFDDKLRAAELQARIRPFILRRTKEEVDSQLPEKTEIVLYCKMKEEQRKIYNGYEKEFRDFVSATTGDELRKSSMNVLKGLTLLRQICNSAQLPARDKVTTAASGKIETLMEQIVGKQKQHKILVFSQFVSMLKLIAPELDKKDIAYTMLTGSTKNRESVVSEFQNDPEIRVFLISLKAGGTGLNLTAADYVYLVDPWWNPAVENQAIDRAHRIGQDNRVIAARLICTDSVEEKMMKLQESKKHLADQLIETGDNFFKSLSREELLGLLS
ncbi:DEAD/DEAH box helicase family protein [Pedobacter sp. HMF7647]|uniref:DEAD/DEAH box helicase family protein n=1 Tax=Hufsiella arboris TaxID=2695275 RepID=A0A7K1Y903_9SPHI|nr:DEAD/DEAH box helicase [Hufsiella arboris]MXV50559.1 DEAD/DEAH box helicase family protein [Hufsiella arboris]